jgi:2,4-dichlorophenol 6-monooxygenase
VLASIIASSIGLTHQVIERRDGLHTEPSAHVLKTHSMESLSARRGRRRDPGTGTPVELQQCITWCESVGGLHYGRLSLAGKKGRVPRFTEISPGHSANLPQSLLEPILHRRAAVMAGRDPVAFGTAFRSLVQDAEGVTATVDGPQGPSEIRARYVIGADGAGSQVRRSVGIAMEGPQALAHFLAIHIKSDMTEALKRGPGVLFFVRTPTREGFFIIHQPVGSQVFMMRFDPETTPFESFDEAQCRTIIEEVMGCAHAFTVSAIDRWAMSAQVAERYREGRVVLVGDAGHRFPPTGGLGLNTGVEDVENLIWKIAAVIRGQADDRLIDTYETECRPIAIRNTNQSVSNHVRMREVALAIGAEDTPDVFAGVIDALRADPHHPRFADIQAAIDAQMPHFAFLEMEMASTAETGAFLPTARRIAEPVEAVEGYRPSFRPGGQMPHLWVEPGVSTVDFMRFDRLTLFAPKQDADVWRQAVAGLGATMAVQVVPIDGAMKNERVSAADFWGGRPFAILARPDGRIAWVESETGEARHDQLAAALATILGGSSPSAATKVA